MPRHFESFASLETFDPNMIAARERLIWLQRLRSGRDVWDDERHFGTLEIAPEDRLQSAIPN
jgi:hypothetical protein